MNSTGPFLQQDNSQSGNCGDKARLEAVLRGNLFSGMFYIPRFPRFIIFFLLRSGYAHKRLLFYFIIIEGGGGGNSFILKLVIIAVLMT